MPPLIIQTEDMLWHVLEGMLRETSFEEVPEIRISGWNPRLLYFPDEPLSRSVSPSTVRALDGYYKSLERAYALLAHGEPDRRLLRPEDREALDVRLLVEGGSTGFKAVDWVIENLTNKVIGKMSGGHLVVLGLGVTALFFTESAFRHWVLEQSQLRRIEIVEAGLTARSQEETRRAEIIAELVRRVPVAGSIKVEADSGKEALVRGAASAPRAEVSGVPLSKEQAEALVSKERRVGEGRRLDGRFKVVDINNEYEGGFVGRFKRDDGLEFEAAIDYADLPREDIQNLFWALQEKSELVILANAWYVGDRINRAVVMRADRPPSSSRL